LKPKQILLRGIALVLVAAISYSSCQLLSIHRKYAQEAEIHERMLFYKPTLQAPMISAPSPSFETDPHVEPIINQSILDLQAKYPDVVGWLAIPNTQIDYPFVQGSDNDHYLHRDLDQNQSQAGTIFMDYRNSKDFSDFNTIIFGHNMRNGSMFGELRNFTDQDFFDNNGTGIIFLATETYEVEFMAFAVIGPDDAAIYNPSIATEADRLAFLSYIRSVARHYRDIGITKEDRIITLSTCSYEFSDARMVLIGRVLPLNHQ
jgi:SrtB family sortase